MNREERLELFRNELNLFKFEDIKEFAEKLIEDAPEYFFHVAASSTGKYHPRYALGERGLVRHTKSVIRLYSYLANLECMKNDLADREVDLGIIACLVHDMFKSGSEEHYKEQIDSGKDVVFTVFNHPLLSAKNIMSYKDSYLTIDELKFIGIAVGSHMGEWNTNKREPEVILPKPNTHMQKLVHMADYLASRKDLDVSFDQDETAYPKVSPGEYKILFGKHAGSMLKDIPEGYLKWLLGTDLKEPLRTNIIEFLKESKQEK